MTMTRQAGGWGAGGVGGDVLEAYMIHDPKQGKRWVGRKLQVYHSLRVEVKKQTSKNTGKASLAMLREQPFHDFAGSSPGKQR